MQQTVVTKRPRRADAQRNYDRILAVARAAVAERGGDVVLEDIAAHAGVGIGTLYRHFPTRQDLMEAAFLDEAIELRDRGESLAGAPVAIDALIDWLHLQLDFGAHGRCMGAAVMNAKHVEGSEIQTACVQVRESGAVLLERAQSAGEVRGGVGIGDVLRLMHGILMVTETVPEEERADAVARMFDLVIAGIRT